MSENSENQTPFSTFSEDETPDQAYNNDLLGRHKQAERLARDIRTLPGPTVFGIYGSYGSGKSYFLKMLQHCLKNPKNDQGNALRTTKINAWQHDIQDDPFTALTVALDDVLDLANSAENTTDKVHDEAKKIITSIGKRAALNALSKASGDLLTANDFQQVFTGSDESAQNPILTRINQYREATQGQQTFKTKVSEVVQSRGIETPIVVFIDELDRCRPDFAVKLLEEVKNFFDLENFVFVIAVDDNQLKKTVSSLYGPIDTDGYLRRFFHWSTRLSTPDYDTYLKSLKKIVYERTGSENLVTGLWGNSVFQLSKTFQVSLRDLNIIFADFAFILNNGIFRDDSVLGCYLVFRTIAQIDRDLYAQIKDRRQRPFERVQKFMERAGFTTDDANEDRRNRVATLASAIAVAMPQQSIEEDIKNHSKTQSSVNQSILTGFEDASRHHSQMGHLYFGDRDILFLVDKLVNSPLSESR